MKHTPIILYIVLILYVIPFHEPWRDEAQAWLIARDIPFFSLYSKIGYEGTPALWHTILAPFAKLGFPYITEHIVHVLFAIASVCLFYYKSPFSFLTKILVIFSYYFVFEYAVIARSYGLSVFFIFLLSTLYNHRFSKPFLYAVLVSLLFNTNVHSFFFSLALTLAFMYEAWKSHIDPKTACIASMLMLFGGGVAIAQLSVDSCCIETSLTPLGEELAITRPSATPLKEPSTEPQNISSLTTYNWTAPLYAVKNAFFLEYHNALAIVACIILQLATCYLMIRYRLLLFVMVFSYSGLFYIFIFEHAGGFRHHGFIFIILLFSLWASGFNTYGKEHSPQFMKMKPEFKVQRYLVLFINFSLCFTVYAGMKNISKEYYYQYSGARAMARFINKNGLNDLTIIAYPAPKGSSILPYIPGKQLYYADIEAYGTYITWDARVSHSQSLDAVEILRRIDEKFANTEVLVLLDKVIDEKKFELNLVYKTEGRVFGMGDERYYLYKKSG